MCMMCEQNLSSDQYLAKMTEVIARAGWAVQGLTDGSLYYTVGLTPKRLPELVTDGHLTHGDHRAAQALLNELARRQVAAGPFEAGQVTEVAGLRLRLVSASVDPLRLVRKLYGYHYDPAALAVTRYVLGGAR